MADPKPRWTDPMGEPLLMLWLACLAVAAGLGALLFFDGAFPLFGQIVTGAAGTALIAASLLAALIAAWLTGRRNMAGWGLALALFVFLAATGIFTFLQRPWHEFMHALGKPGAAQGTQSSAKIAAMFVGAAFAPLAMVLLMARGAFRHSEFHESAHH